MYVNEDILFSSNIKCNVLSLINDGSIIGDVIVTSILRILSGSCLARGVKAVFGQKLDRPRLS